ncbi:glycosyltransferase family 2 protein [Seleniivibrio woodruffii]|uniref:glycosyltransferase n=1 Tax=Seleniivibrio woodruffii TaxID=1078050 RepID=UPI0026E9203E|nr:glycosyltransferase [Seleniivibrio woodruffii]
MNIDISLIITFHHEGTLAHITLNSIERCRRFAEKNGIRCEYIWVLDNIDEETGRVLENHPADRDIVKMLEVDCKDAGKSRNEGIAAASADTIAIFDGDDLYSENWIERSMYYLKQYGDNVILHPEYMVTFDQIKCFGRQIDQTENKFSIDGLLTSNYWTSAWTIARKSVYQKVPYVGTHVKETGFAFEDWHWNCETVAAGFVHRLTPETVGFYRRRQGSRIMSETSANGIMRPSGIFSKDFNGAGDAISA